MRIARPLLIFHASYKAIPTINRLMGLCTSHQDRQCRRNGKGNDQKVGNGKYRHTGSGLGCGIGGLRLLCFGIFRGSFLAG